MAAVPNIHGRKPSRGLRPWLLVPKVLSVAALLGGLGALTAIAATSRPTTPGQWRLLEAALTHIYRGVVLPGVLGALVFGLLLLWHHGPGLMLRQRWLQVKLALAAPIILFLHLESRGLILALRHQIASGTPQSTTLHHLAWVSGIGLGLLVLVLILGRIKPRLGQNWARAYPGPSRPTPGSQP